MVLDSHQHFWQYNPERDTWIDETMQVIRRDFMPDDLKPVLIENNIDACVAVQADQSKEETRFLLNLAKENTFIKGVVGWVDLCNENVEESLYYFSQDKILKGIRHIVQAEKNDFLLREDFQRGISILLKYDLTYDILIRNEQLENTIEFVKRNPNQLFVLDHIAKPDIKNGYIEMWKKNIEDLSKHDNVFCKVSGLLTEADWLQWQYEDFLPYLDIVFESFGTDRTMFGSDWPVCLLAASYRDAKAIVEKYIETFSKAEKENFMGRNARKFYKI